MGKKSQRLACGRPQLAGVTAVPASPNTHLRISQEPTSCALYLNELPLIPGVTDFLLDVLGGEGVANRVGSGKVDGGRGRVIN